ncbi:MAG TPA: hypothetical protein VFX76_08350 [Roseiflexaceae bacterium]|nr:hypothetical protein [Roseiflexaceae bacterium]
MKLIARTLAIVMLALLVVGATIAIVGTGSTASAAQAGEVRQPPEGLEGANGAGRPEGHGDGGASLFGVAEVGMDLGIIGVIVAVVAFVKRLAFGRRPRTRGAAIASEASNSLVTERISNS